MIGFHRSSDTSRAEGPRFVSWLAGTHTQAEIDGTATGRSFRRATAWCWDVQPRLEPVTTIHHAVLVNGIWIGTWCLLIAVSDCGDVLAWQWCGREITAACTALLGMNEAHRRRAVEWFLVLQQLPLEDALTLATTPPATTAASDPEPEDEPLGPALYDTGLDDSEGLWLRSGWAGRG